MNRILPERELLILMLIFQHLSQFTQGLKPWKSGKVINLGRFESFKTEQWETLEILVNQEIPANFLNQERDRSGVIISGSTGLTTLRKREVYKKVDGICVRTHADDFINFQTIRKMWNRTLTQGPNEKSFQRSKLSALAIACGYDGIVGIENDLRLD